MTTERTKNGMEMEYRRKDGRRCRYGSSRNEVISRSDLVGNYGAHYNKHARLATIRKCNSWINPSFILLFYFFILFYIS
jgi:hypothetical protein